MTVTSTVRLWTVVIVASLSVLAGTAGIVGRQSTGKQDVIAGPDTWVPITYEVRVSNNGIEEATYTISRSADGSTRKEHSSGQLIEIVNPGTGHFYRYEHGTWYAHPLRRQANGGRPFFKVARSAVADVAYTDARVAGIAAAGVSCSLVETLARNAALTKILCPELNLLDVYTRIAHDGHVVERMLTHIMVGEPQAVFLPPPGVTVLQRPEPAGPGYVSATPGGTTMRDGKLVTRYP